MHLVLSLVVLLPPDHQEQSQQQVRRQHPLAGQFKCKHPLGVSRAVELRGLKLWSTALPPLLPALPPLPPWPQSHSL